MDYYDKIKSEKLVNMKEFLLCMLRGFRYEKAQSCTTRKFRSLPEALVRLCCTKRVIPATGWYDGMEEGGAG
jgi:hypothetical protein